MKEYIVVVKDAVPLELCDIVLKEYKDTYEWNTAITANNSNEKERNCDSIEISQSLVINNNFKRKEIDNKLFDSASKCIKEYNNKIETNMQIAIHSLHPTSLKEMCDLSDLVISISCIFESPN